MAQKKIKKITITPTPALPFICVASILRVVLHSGAKMQCWLKLVQNVSIACQSIACSSAQAARQLQKEHRSDWIVTIWQHSVSVVGAHLKSPRSAACAFALLFQIQYALNIFFNLWVNWLIERLNWARSCCLVVCFLLCYVWFFLSNHMYEAVGPIKTLATGSHHMCWKRAAFQRLLQCSQGESTLRL